MCFWGSVVPTVMSPGLIGAEREFRSDPTGPGTRTVHGMACGQRSLVSRDIPRASVPLSLPPLQTCLDGDYEVGDKAES